MTKRTFEEIRVLLYSIAKRYVNNRFEIDELVNEVWLRGSIQTIDQRLLSRRINWDIIDYIRSQGMRREYTRSEELNEKLFRLQFPMYYNHFEIFDIPVYDNCILDNHDWFDWVISGLSRIDTLIIKLRYLEDFTFKEIGKVIGYSESRISQKHKQLIEKLRDKHRGLVF